MTQKSIETLIPDIQHVLATGEGWTDDLSTQYGRESELLLLGRMGERSDDGNYLRLSNVGTPCDRKLWYTVNHPHEGEAFGPDTLLKFLYGDLVELLVLYLARAAGHSVEGTQSTLEVRGVKGHRDAVIDGVTCDVKSASSYSFAKFRDHKLLDDDPFAYIGQLKSYLLASRDDPIVTDKNRAAFLVLDKTLGHMCLDEWEWSDKELHEHERFIESQKFMVAEASRPDRDFHPVPDGKAGNMKLPMFCSYCSYKEMCHDNKLRKFIYSNGPRFLTHVVRLPDVQEARG